MSEYVEKLSLTLNRLLFEKINPGTMVIFRILFGSIMLWEVFRYYSADKIARYYIDVEFTFPFMFLPFVKPWSGDGMYYHFIVMGILASFIIVGFLYRVSAILFFFSFTYIFLLCQTRYLNHFYLVCLISFLMIFMPANKMFSLDRLIFKKKSSDTSIYRWTLLILQLQIGLVYFWGGIAKINKDWLVGNPMRSWLGDRVGFPLVGHLFREEWMIYFVSYSGLLIDLFAMPLLFYRKTRLIAFIVVSSFHLTNARLFSIGIFPWFMFGASLIFFDSAWPGKLCKKIATLFDATFEKTKKTILPKMEDLKNISFRKPIIGFFCVYLAFQLLLPLRHFIYPGEPSWNEEGHNFAWHMKLRSKKVKMKILAQDKDSGERWEIDPYQYVTHRQWRKINSRPTLLLQLAHIIEEDYKFYEDTNIGVYVESFANLNSRGYHPFTDSSVDLTLHNESVLPYQWIVQFDKSKVVTGKPIQFAEE